MNDRISPVHPGEVLMEEFIRPLRIAQAKVAAATRISPVRIGNLVHRRGRLDAETALRLGHFFGTSPQFWLGLQMDHDLDVSNDALGEQIATEVDRLRV